MGRPIKYNQKAINEIHLHGFIQDKLKNREIADKYNITDNQFDYLLYRRKCTNDKCKRCNPPKTITQSLIDFFTFKQS
tara:strand:- start:334 stop:567 length:234 start_codon:yes stop_codon:yes gene_type:complete